MPPQLDNRLGMDASAPKKPETAGKNVLDVRGLAAPEDVLAVLKRASDLQGKAEIDFVIGSNPFQLYDLLQQRGYTLEMLAEGGGTFHGRATPRDVKAPAH